MLARMLPRVDYAGGVSGQAHLLATELHRRGHHVTVFAQNEAPAGSVYDAHVVGAAAIGSRLRSLYQFPWAVAGQSFDDFDVVHAHGDDHLLHTRCPVVRTFYGTARGEQRSAVTFRQRLYHMSMTLPEWVSERRAAEIVAISRSTAADLGRASTVIPCAYDPAIFFPSGEKSVAPSILFVGDLGTRKRAECLLSVFREVVTPAIPHAELWLVTSTEIRAPGVRWLGRVATLDLARLYAQAWLFCLPSRYEGFGVPYIEALACGTPAVATPNGGSEEALAPALRELIVPEADLGDMLVALLSDRHRRDRLAATGRQHVLEYRIERTAARYLEVYQRAIAGMRITSAA